MKKKFFTILFSVALMFSSISFSADKCEECEVGDISCGGDSSGDCMSVELGE